MSLARKVTPIPTMSKLRSDSLTEAWIANRLSLPELFAGHTSTETRRDRLKVVLLERGLTESIAGTHDGKPVKWAAIFERLYGERL